jgi:NADPH:quinone reductase-like Zn-dependent oxidoreductase
MRVWQLNEIGLEGLHLTYPPKPSHGPNEILIRVHATSLNYRDWEILIGKYAVPPSLPLIIASDAAGEVVAIGSKVSRFRQGDRVIGTFRQCWTDGRPTASQLSSILGGPLSGVLSEYIVLHEEGAVAAPDYLSYVQASTLPLAALTAWNALVEDGPVLPGETVLVQGSGGVSIFALQIARASGARVIALSSSDEKLDRLKSLGADDGINYAKRSDWDRAVLDLTNGEGVDHVVEIAGGQSLQRSINALRFGGHVAVVGYLDSKTTSIEVVSLLWKRARVQGVSIGSRRSFERMLETFRKHSIAPVVDAVYPFSRAHDAFAHLSRGTFGKVVIEAEN